MWSIRWFENREIKVIKSTNVIKFTKEFENIIMGAQLSNQ